MEQVAMHTASGSARSIDAAASSSPESMAAMASSALSESGGMGAAAAGPGVSRETRSIEITLSGRELGEATGVKVTLVAATSRCYGARGELLASHAHEPDDDDIGAAQSYVAHLVREGKLHIPEPGESVSAAALAAAGTPFYLETDEGGGKRLRRSYFA